MITGFSGKIVSARHRQRRPAATQNLTRLDQQSLSLLKSRIILLTVSFYMQTRKVGSLQVSVVGLGCNNFGWRIDAEASAKVIDAAIESGVTFFDTADRYGKGQSEDFLGRALGKRRDQIILATKFGMEMEKGQQGASPNIFRKQSTRVCGDCGRIGLISINYISPTRRHRSRIRWAHSMNSCAREKCARSVAPIFPLPRYGKRRMPHKAVPNLSAFKTNSVFSIANRKQTGCCRNAKDADSHFSPISR